MNKIKDIVIAVTYRCNARCRMCSIWRDTANTSEISRESILMLPRNIKDVNLSGGEPFLHSDLPGIVSAVVERCPDARIIISSNGFATDLILSRMEAIKAIKPDVGLAISIDGIGAKHDEIRGIAGGFDRAIATIGRLKEMGITNLRLAFTIGDYNHEELMKVYELSRSLGIEMTVAAVHSSDSYFKQENEMGEKVEIAASLEKLITEELSSWSPKRWARAYFTHGLREFVLTGKRILPDYSGEENAFIDSLGFVYPCDIANKPMGRLTDEGLALSGKASDSRCAESWMICTARQAMRKHLGVVGVWIMINKLRRIIGLYDRTR